MNLKFLSKTKYFLNNFLVGKKYLNKCDYDQKKFKRSLNTINKNSFSIDVDYTSFKRKLSTRKKMSDYGRYQVKNLIIKLLLILGPYPCN